LDVYHLDGLNQITVSSYAIGSSHDTSLCGERQNGLRRFGLALFQAVAARPLAKPAFTGLGRYQLPRFGTAVSIINRVRKPDNRWARGSFLLFACLLLNAVAAFASIRFLKSQPGTFDFADQKSVPPSFGKGEFSFERMTRPTHIELWSCTTRDRSRGPQRDLLYPRAATQLFHHSRINVSLTQTGNCRENAGVSQCERTSNTVPHLALPLLRLLDRAVFAPTSRRLGNPLRIHEKDKLK
jgi:hypothetical protein